MSTSYFNERLSAAVPREMHAAAAKVAVRKGITLADFVRTAVQRELAVAGVPHPGIPELRRTTILHGLAKP
ncbi:hypothetical protein [Methylobacterium sp. E-046]|uniref:hypothetical protein n=1 Tax=Methylobacterium sp. E-046 TaxID=2836576 RepID=UPI001FB8DA09|nr:hypothetical protein [Methylobacterium sp. E-046]MCJ2099360.1 hypothetical protein [Methylobacterium sp. E-046]